MKFKTCPGCEEYKEVPTEDYLCIRCRGRLDGTGCDHCGEPYDSSLWKHLPWKETIGKAPRFAGLCLDCKDIAAEAVPVEPEWEPTRSIDVYVAYLRDLRAYQRGDWVEPPLIEPWQNQA